MNIYATESMTYVTAALMDSFAQPDASVEAAIVKVTISLKVQMKENYLAKSACDQLIN